VTVDESGPDEVPGQSAPSAGVGTARAAASQAALQRYRSRMRRSRLGYFGVLAVVIIGLGSAVGVVWSRGETAHTTLRTAAHPAPSLVPQPPSATLRQLWHSDDRTAIGTPYWGGTVLTYTRDSVRGRDARTGAVMWSYTRTDRTVCQAIQDQGVSVAVFEHGGNCDEITALDSGTGARRWTRTLDKGEGQGGQPVDGQPSYSLTRYALMITTPSVIYTIDPSGGLDRWIYHPDGCTIHGAVIGSQGALISQSCAHPNCDGRTFCGVGPQLLLRDPSAGRSDDDKDKANPDQIKWNLIGTDAVPASADGLISAVDLATGRLQVLSPDKGRTLSRLGRQGQLTAADNSTAQETDRAELLWLAGTTYAVERSGARFLWTAATPGPPTVTQLAAPPGGIPQLRLSIIAAAGSGGISLLDPSTGTVTRNVPVGGPPPGSRAYPLGTGFVVAGPSTTVYE
jgi:outer membrane protein assembly factor BamB